MFTTLNNHRADNVLKRTRGLELINMKQSACSRSQGNFCIPLFVFIEILKLMNYDNPISGSGLFCFALFRFMSLVGSGQITPSDILGRPKSMAPQTNVDWPGGSVDREYFSPSVVASRRWSKLLESSRTGPDPR